MRAPVRIGLQLPRFDFPGVGAGRPASTGSIGIAATAEASGFDSLFVMDHLHQIPGVGEQPELDARGEHVLAALAGAHRAR